LINSLGCVTCEINVDFAHKVWIAAFRKKRKNEMEPATSKKVKLTAQTVRGFDLWKSHYLKGISYFTEYKTSTVNQFIIDCNGFNYNTF
jgi:beta-xylosidase